MSDQLKGSGIAVGMFFGICMTLAVIAAAGWYNGWSVSFKETGSNSSSTHSALSRPHVDLLARGAWEIACQEVSTRLHTSACAVFPDVPASELGDVEDRFILFSRDLNMGMVAHSAWRVVGSDAAEKKYFEWRESIFDRVKLVVKDGEWAATGWVDAQDRHGAMTRIWWAVHLKLRADGGKEYDVRFTDWLE